MKIIKNIDHSEIKALRKDVDQIKRTMVTKDEAKNFATKEDLKAFATKEDLKPFATKEDLNPFATKDALGKLSIAFLDMSKRVTRIEQTMATKSDVHLILDRIDAFTKKVDVFDKKVVVHDYRLNEMEPKIIDHENRLRAIELKR